MTGKNAIAQKQCDSPTRLKSASAKKFDLLDTNPEELQGTDSSNDSAIDDQDHFMIVQKSYSIDSLTLFSVQSAIQVGWNSTLTIPVK